ncbi:MAG: hypothetical protein JKY09_04825 [Crocinitomicaceae bacterium]|nr:hypothetical protein [Crocinitomicaceae bacterium]
MKNVNKPCNECNETGEREINDINFTCMICEGRGSVISEDIGNCESWETDWTTVSVRHPEMTEVAYLLWELNRQLKDS